MRNVSSRGILICDGPLIQQQTSDCKMLATTVHLQLGQLLSDFCALPVPKGPKNLSWLEKKTETRELLSKFWQCVRETWTVSQLVSLTSDALKADILSRISFDVSPEYLARLQGERRHIEDRDQREKRLKAPQQSSGQFIQQPLDTGASGNGVVRTKLAKRSDTLRKDASPQDLNFDQAPAKSKDAVSPGPIAVKQDTLSLMAKMFPAGTDDTSGVRWTQLVQALTDAGMSATQGSGSAVVFNNSYGSICLHMPHSEPFVDAYRLRGFGERLNKWFGWTNETFVLRQKEDTEVQKDVAK
jgi:hypothetical protein